MKRLTFPVIATHITGWLFFQSLPMIFLMSFSGNTDLLSIISTWQYWMFSMYYVAVFYLHSYLLWPLNFLKNKRWLYFLLLILLVVTVFTIQPFEKFMMHNGRGGPRNEKMDKRQPPPDGQHMQPPPMDKLHDRGRRGPAIDIISIILFVMTIALSIATDITRRWQRTEERAIRAEADKANAELSFLKAQVNPHFLFNTLNNIYSMAVTKNEHTAETVMKLSNIMRYVTDDVNEDFVSLQNEVDCITDYIDLQKLRLGKKVTLEFEVTGDLENKKIAPLLLMTFIENVFKYGISNHEQSKLVIRLTAGEKLIDFFTQNQLFAVARKPDRTGIGIGNTKKRLAHLYPGKHELQILKENGLFTVHLSIPS